MGFFSGSEVNCSKSLVLLFFFCSTSTRKLIIGPRTAQKRPRFMILWCWNPWKNPWPLLCSTTSMNWSFHWETLETLLLGADAEDQTSLTKTASSGVCLKNYHKRILPRSQSSSICCFHSSKYSSVKTCLWTANISMFTLTNHRL